MGKQGGSSGRTRALGIALAFTPMLLVFTVVVAAQEEPTEQAESAKTPGEAEPQAKQKAPNNLLMLSEESRFVGPISICEKEPCAPGELRLDVDEEEIRKSIYDQCIAGLPEALRNTEVGRGKCRGEVLSLDDNLTTRYDVTPPLLGIDAYLFNKNAQEHFF